MILEFLLSRFGIATMIIAAFFSFIAYVHHAGAKSEAQKIQLSTAAIVAKIQGAKDEIRSHGYSDNITARRLRAGTF